MNKLFLLETAGLGSYYIISSDPTSAENFLKKKLNESNYGFSGGRKVTRISIITEEIGEKPFIFSDDKRLLINYE